MTRELDDSDLPAQETDPGQTVLELSFPAPGRPMSVNQANKLHWAARRRAMEPWREAIGYAWLIARPYWWKVKNKRCVLEFDFPFPDTRRRDPHNYVSPLVKSLVDALVEQGVWPDDTPEWVSTTEPNLTRGTECRIRLIPQPCLPAAQFAGEIGSFPPGSEASKKRVVAPKSRRATPSS